MNIDSNQYPEEGFLNLQKENAYKTYRLFAEDLPHCVIALYPSGRIFYSNGCFYKLTGFSIDEIQGKFFVDLVSPSHRISFERLLKSVKNDKRKQEDFITIRSREGNEIPFLISLAKLNLDHHSAIRIVLTDLTKIIELEKKLEHSILKQSRSEEKVHQLVKELKARVKELKTVNTRLEAFAYITSHHLQEPLRKIRTFGGLLRNKYFPVIEETGKDYIDKIESCSTRMQNMIDDVLSYSKLAGNPIFQNCDLQKIVNEVLNELEILISESHSEIKISSKLPSLDANCAQLHLLFQNIIENSIKFRNTNIPPVIEISCQFVKGKELKKIGTEREDDQFCKLVIKDNGEGFPNKYASQIFLLFKKLNQNDKGTGIGLAICQTIVDNHQGYIYAESKKGKGTSISIILPMRQSFDQKIQNKPLQIIIADDDEDDRNLMQLAFQEINRPLSLEFAKDGEQLITELRKKVEQTLQLPDLILLDLNMPKKDGRVVLKEIKSDEKLHNLHVIVFSTSQSPEDKKMAIDLGAEAFISKPADFNDMVNLFHKIYEERTKTILEKLN